MHSEPYKFDNEDELFLSRPLLLWLERAFGVTWQNVSPALWSIHYTHLWPRRFVVAQGGEFTRYELPLQGRPVLPRYLHGEDGQVPNIL